MDFGSVYSKDHRCCSQLTTVIFLAPFLKCFKWYLIKPSCTARKTRLLCSKRKRQTDSPLIAKYAHRSCEWPSANSHITKLNIGTLYSHSERSKISCRGGIVHSLMTGEFTELHKTKTYITVSTAHLCSDIQEHNRNCRAMTPSVFFNFVVGCF